MMQIGMLWLDNSQAPLPEKVERACSYYKTKYGTAPDLVYVHPTTEGAPAQLDGVAVKVRKQIRPNYLWVGIGVKE
jgi:hypothetical protein